MFRSFLRKYKYHCVLVFLYVLAEIIVKPTGEFPINDDWSYAKTVHLLYSKGELNIGPWCGMTLVVHALWGYLWVKLFGFSYFVLRFSTIVAAIIGSLVMFGLVKRITQKNDLAFLTALLLLFNPLYFHLSNSFMTDITFCVLLLVTLYIGFRFFEQPHWKWMGAFMLLCGLLIFTRQFALVLPFCFTIACLFLKQNRTRYVIAGVCASVMLFFSFWLYNRYILHTLTPYASYVTSNSMDLTSSDFYSAVQNRAADFTLPVFQYILVFVAPFSIYYLVRNFRSSGWKVQLISIVLGFSIGFYTFFYLDFFVGNILINMNLGPENFYQTFMEWGNARGMHTFDQQIGGLIRSPKWMVVSLSLSGFILAMLNECRNWYASRKLNPTVVLLFSFGVAYFLLLFVSPTFFDRYTLPLVVVVTLLLALAQWKSNSARLGWQILPASFVLLVFAYVSVAGTKDHMTMNNKRWEAASYLMHTMNVPRTDINAGFEFCCGEAEQPTWDVYYTILQPYDYLVQYRCEPGFENLKSFPFQRYLPYRSDTLNCLVRTQPVKADSLEQK